MRHPGTIQHGFTLIELAVVIAVVGLLLGGLVMGMSVQVEIQRTNETRATLEQVRDALIGFAASKGRLPCPASAGNNGQESFCTTASGGCTETPMIQQHGRCSNFFNGFVPAAALGITPTDNQGYALDGWGNRLRYAVSDAQMDSTYYVFTGREMTTLQDGMKSATMATIEAKADSGTWPVSGTGMLVVCSRSNGINSTGCGSASGTVTLTRKTPAIIYSTGKNTAAGGTAADETANPNPKSGDNDRVFIHHEPAPPEASNGEFDDIMTWLSLPVLFNRMIVAGRLP